MNNENSHPTLDKETLHTLIIDDSVQDYNLISVMIRSYSSLEYEFYRAKTAQEAKTVLAEHRIDVVAVDYNLEEEFGHNVIRELSALYPSLAYIMITGVEDPELYKLGIEAGASDFIVKNDNNAKLFDKTVQYAVENKRIQNSLIASNESKTGSWRFSLTSLKARCPTSSSLWAT